MIEITNAKARIPLQTIIKDELSTWVPPHFQKNLETKFRISENSGSLRRPFISARNNT